MANQKKSTNRAGQVKMDVAVVLSTTRVTLETLLNCSEGSILEMNKRAGETVDVEVNGTPFAKGDVVTVAEHFGVRITEKL
jgi:flagellar motor switch protein FliN